MALLCVIVLAVAASLCAGQTSGECTAAPPSCPSRAPSEELLKHKATKNIIGRVTGLATNGPFTSELRKRPRDRASVREFVEFLRSAQRGIEKKKQKTAGSDCNLRGHDWTNMAREAVRNDRKIGDLNTACTTSFEHTKAEALHAQALFRRLADGFRRAGAPTAAAQQWERGGAYALRSWSYSSLESKQKCTIERATAVMRDDKWYVLAQLTSDPVEDLRASKERRLAEEWVREDFCCPLTVHIQRWALNNSEAVADGGVAPYSTTTAVLDGSAHISAFYDMDWLKNQPLSDSLLQNELAVDQADDAVRPSNVAILALPMALSFIPVALIADVNDFAAFVYVIFTDFFSAVPFVIKGVELLSTGTVQYTNAQTWIVGNESLAVAESWAAACQPDTSFKTSGIVFISVGIAVILTGFALEHAARKYMRRRIQQGEEPRPLGDALFPISHHPLLPRDYDENDENAPNFAADVPAPPPTAPPPFSALYRRFIRRRAAVAPPAAPSPSAPVLGTGAGLGMAAAAATARAPAPNELPRAPDDRWYV